ncbi:hypothetical protein [Campylobacter sp. 7477a]|uniref:hypothetical protein n=1 Tax=Campylobacter sp. 7477a TaxID=2735741 RepID=UPI0030147CCB|nr:hypothetical protein [Campylobacter sp. 7477a]
MTPCEVKKHGMDENGVIDAKSIICGAKPVNETTRYLEPKALDEKCFTGTTYLYSSCHTNSNTASNQSPFISITAKFPRYNA